MNDYERLEKLIGKEFDSEEVMSCMYDFNEMIIISKRNITSNIEGYGECKLYEAYYDADDALINEIWVDKNNIIVKA